MIRYFFPLLAVLLTGCGQSKPTLRVFIFPDYIDPKIVADFERQFDCKVSFDYYDDNESMMAKLSAGGTALYDIVTPSNFVMPTMVGRGLLSPLRHENIPNLRNLDPQFADQPWDPGNRYSVPYHWGMIGLYIRKPGNVQIDESWGLLFDPAKQLGSFVLIDEMRACIGAALLYKGYSINTANPKELVEARDLLLEAKKRSLGFQSAEAIRNRVLSKSVSATIALNDRISADVKEDPETYFFVPREGSLIAVDHFGIPAKAPHRDLAEKFLNYLLDAKVAAQNAIFVGMGTPNKAAKDQLSPNARNDPFVYPPSEVMRRLQFQQGLGDKEKLYDEIWTQIKAK